MKQNNHSGGPSKSNGELHINKKVAGGATGVVVGAMVGGPVGAIIGGVVGTALGSASESDKPAAAAVKTAAHRVVAKAKTAVKKTSRKPAVKKAARAVHRVSRKVRSKAVHVKKAVVKSAGTRKKAKKK